TEIGARNLADTDRYDLLPVVAERIGLDMSSDRTLWRDRAVGGVDRAVVAAVGRAGGPVSRHPPPAQRLPAPIARASRAGRETPGVGGGIVRRLSGAPTGVFHRHCAGPALTPNFYRAAEARDWGRGGRPPQPAAGRVLARRIEPDEPPPDCSRVTPRRRGL